MLLLLWIKYVTLYHRKPEKIRSCLINQLPDLTASATEHNTDIICLQEHTYYHSELDLKYNDSCNGWIFISASSWTNCMNAAFGGVGMLFNPRAFKSQNSKDKTQRRILCATFNGSPITRIFYCYCPTNATDETDITTFLDEFSFLVRHSPKYNVLINGGDMNVP